MDTATENTCVVCGGNEFETIDGFFFCTECNTQSQVIRVVEEKQQEYQEAGVAAALFMKKKPKPKADKKATEEKDKIVIPELGPYGLYESYTVLIRRQVEALIQLGAPEALKNCVFDLWIKYLHYSDIAFTDLHLSEPDIRSFASWSSRYQHISGTRWSNDLRLKDIEVEMDSLHLAEENQPTSSSATNEPKKKAPPKFPFSQSHCLSLVYIGCRILKVELLLSDLMRFAYNSLIPYNFTDSNLPLRLKTCQEMAHDRIPLIDVFQFNVALLVRFIGEPRIEHQDDLFADTITRFIINLNLPHALIDRVSYIVSIFPPNTTFVDLDAKSVGAKQQSTLVDLSAMVYILCTLMLMFGLDDCQENRLSTLAEQMSAETMTEEIPFNVNRWLMQCRMRRAVMNGTPLAIVLRKDWFDRSEKDICSLERSLWLGYDRRDEKGHLSLMKVFDVPVRCDAIQSTLFPLKDVASNIPSDVLSQSGVDQQSLETFTADFSHCSLDFNTNATTTRNTRASTAHGDIVNLFASCGSQFLTKGDIGKLCDPAELESVLPLQLEFLLKLLAELVFARPQKLLIDVAELQRKIYGQQWKKKLNENRRRRYAKLKLKRQPELIGWTKT